MPTIEQQRIYELFRNSNPLANFAPQVSDPTLQQDVRGTNPAQDYSASQTSVPLISEQSKPRTDYQEALRNRLAQVSELGRNQTAIAFESRQRQQINAQQSYGSGQVLGQTTQYGNIGDKRQAVLAAVAAQAGTPYSWGGGNASGATRGIGRGANTVGFDCSGLVQYAYAQIGMKMPRLAEQQQMVGRRTNNIGSLRAGDLVAGPHHIAIYAGNGMMWEAPRTGLNVRLTPVRKGMVGVALNY